MVEEFRDSCDLVMAWTNFTGEARSRFKGSFSFDQDTWTRAKGWGLWKALITLAALENTSDTKYSKVEGVVKDILHD